MARITICDLCKERIKDEESKQGELTLSFYEAIIDTDDTDGIDREHKELCGELCHKCTTLLRKTIQGEKPLVAEKAQKKPSHRTRTQEPDEEEDVLYAAPDAPLGPSEEEKAAREPTKELLDDEMVKVPSRFDKRRANKIIDKQKGKCPHHFKSFKDGKVVCSAAPDGYQGDFASFRGCGKTLQPGEY